MKIILSLCFLLLTSSLFCQFSPSPGILLAHNVSQRYWVKHQQVDVGVYIRDEVYQYYREKKLVLTKAQEEQWSNYRYHKPEFNIGIPYCYLFHEDDYWAKRVYREIEIYDNENYVLYKGGRTIEQTYEGDRSIRLDTFYWNEESNLLNIIKKQIQEGNLYTYNSEDYHNRCDSNETESITLKWKEIYKIRLFEDWYYDKQSGDFKNQILGFSFIRKKENNDEELFWIYFPELKWTLKNHAINGSYMKFSTLNNLFEKHMLKSKIIKVDKVRNRYVSLVNNHNDIDYNEHRTDFNALWNIQLIKEEFVKKDSFFTTTNNSYYGILDGEVEFINPYDSTLVKVNFKNNIPHGAYTSYWRNGKLQESGTFDFGLKEGVWKDYFENGKKKSLKNYHKGWFDGDQKVWYQNGKKHLEFYYENFKINSEFTRWDNQGKIMENGYFKDNYMDSLWTINFKVPEIYSDVINSNPNLEWSKTALAAKDGEVSYTVLLKQNYEFKYCPFEPCVNIVEFGEFK